MSTEAIFALAGVLVGVIADRLYAYWVRVRSVLEEFEFPYDSAQDDEAA